MNDRIVADAHAWVEYLGGTSRGMRLRDFLGGEAEVYTCAVTLAEVVSKAARTGKDHRTAYDVINGNSTIVDADEQLSYQAGVLHAEVRQTVHDFGLADAYVLACARRLDARVLTGDPHFAGIEDAIMI